MVNKSKNTYHNGVKTTYEILNKENTPCFLDTELDEVLCGISDDVDTDFAGALRLLSFSDKIIQPFEKKFIIDTLSLELGSYSEKQKLSLAQALQMSGRISCGLADMLLLDSSSCVQKTLLKNYPYHGEDALISVATQADIDVLEVIAERADLTKKTVKALLERDIVEVSRIVLLNKRAACDVSFLGHQVKNAITDETACLAMLDLPDMEPATALHLFWSAPSSVRRAILKRFLKSHVLVEGHFARMQGPNLRSLPLFSALSAENLNIDSVAQGFEAAIDYFRQGQVTNGIRLLALCASLPLSLLHKISHDKRGEGMVVLLKALGLDRARAQNYIQRISECALAKEWASLDALQEVYDTITWGEARMAVSYWLWQIDSIGPYSCYQAAEEEERFLENSSATDFSPEPELREGALGE
jgi:hypothetical protein